MKRIPIIIDTDPGIDDAAAIGLAIHREELDIKLITTVTGNVGIEKTTDNALKLMTFFGQEIPVARGMETPLIQPVYGSRVHGESGMDGYDFKKSNLSVIEDHAVEAIRKLIETEEEKLTIVAIGPLTNIAMLLLMYPNLKDRIDKIVLMGGSLSGGNMNGPAEFNFWADPHAAKIVFESGMDIIMIGLDVTRKALIGEEELSATNRKNEAAEMFSAIFHHYRDGDMEHGVVMHDSCAIAYITNPELFTIEPKQVQVVTEGPAAGMSMEKPEETEHNIGVAMEIDGAAFQEWFIATLDRMK